ncbi:MAG: extracellular solute-binding protein [Clostridiales bacterium]|nr:extracellular solute-binding protein [Clostridiales bacterium]
MKKTKMFLALLLAAAIALPMISGCGDEGKTTAETSAAETETVAEVTTDPNDRSGYKDSLPEDIDLGGVTIGVYCCKTFNNTDFIMGAEEPSGDLVEDAVMERNEKVFERLNVNIKYNLTDTAYYEIGNVVNKFVMAGDSTYDYFTGAQFGLVQQATEGVFYNVFDLPYIDFDQPWWWNGYMDEISIGADKRFFLVGDYFIDMLRGTRVLYFNKTLYENQLGNPDDLYNVALEGNWTLERMAELVKGMYRDLNGNTVFDEEDQYGFATYVTYSSSDAFAFATDIRMTERGDDGTMTFTMGTERQLKAADLINAVFWNEGSYISKIDTDKATPIFKNGNSLMLGNSSIGTSEIFRDMEDDFGMVPYPKLDDTQENYRSLVHDTQNFGVVPLCCAHPDETGAVLEAMSSETWKTLTPTYYETALKVKYVRDELSAQIIDIIHDSIATEFAFVYYASLSNAGMIYRNLITNNSSDFMSEWAKMQKSAEKALDKLNATYLEKN